MKWLNLVPVDRTQKSEIVTVDSGNDDLNWDISFLQNRGRAVSFLDMLDGKISVYSETVEQLYTNYEVHLPSNTESKLVILPNPLHFHDTFNKITPSSVESTGITIFPVYKEDRVYPLIRIKLKKTVPGHRKRIVYTKDFPLSVGLMFLSKNWPPNRPFLPVLMKGDLRAFDTNTPSLHLHNMRADRLTFQSDLERSQITKTLHARVLELALLMRQNHNHISSKYA